MRSEFPPFPSSAIFRVSCFVMLTAVAGCSSEAQRIEMPWSVPVASKASSFDNQNEYTGSIASSRNVKSQSLPSAASASPATPVMQVEPKQIASSVHVFVENGDTLYSIARRNNVPVGKLMAANNLTDANAIKAGQSLVLPGAKSAAVQEPVAKIFAASAEATIPGRHVVKSGETLSSISRQYNVAPGELVRVNSFGPNDSLKVGQDLSIPGKEQPKEKTVRVIPMNNSDAEKPAPVEVEERVAKIEKPEVTASLPNPEPMNSTEFRWPVQGRVVQAYGAQQGGGRNDGINIAVPAGTPIKAAENGVVAYAGSELKGYGKLILIRHDNDYVTAYAHNSDISVKRGDKVTRGQVIGKAGQTGDVTQPQLHFEIRKGSSPVDPLSHLSGG